VAKHALDPFCGQIRERTSQVEEERELPGGGGTRAVCEAFGEDD
jgi:hypothetical protein